MKNLLSTMSLVLLVSMACVEQETAQTGTTVPAATEASTQTAAGQPYDLQFIDTMIAHHKQAIQMSEMAGRKAGSAVKSLAARIASDQQKEVETLQGWRDQWHAGQPEAHNMDMPGASSMNMDMTHMESMSGRSFDTMFIDMMIPHHQGAITMSQDALQRAEHTEIKDFAQQTIDKQQKEIEELRRMKS